MRIIAGTHRGTILSEVGRGDPSAQLRPTTDRVRESLFNMLCGGRFGDPIKGARVLDLFAGTGALGLEALSRGAEHVTFVEDGRAAQNLISENILKLRRTADTALLKVHVNLLPPTAHPCRLVFLDPPYGQGLGPAALVVAVKKGWIVPKTIVSWEERMPQPAPHGFTQLDQRRYGDTWITLLEAE